MNTTPPEDSSTPASNSTPPASDGSSRELADNEFPNDLAAAWRRTKCMNCGYLHEGTEVLKKCPKCGNEDPDKFEEGE